MIGLLDRQLCCLPTCVSGTDHYITGNFMAVALVTVGIDFTKIKQLMDSTATGNCTIEPRVPIVTIVIILLPLFLCV